MDKKSIIISILLVLLMVGIFGAGLYFFNDVEEENEIEENIMEEIEVPKHTEEDIEVAYEEAINVYLFWGNGCAHCNNLKAFFADIEDEYGEYYDLYTFEVWYNEDNEALMNKFAASLDDTVKGVPYLVIGDQSFKGYSSSMNDRIIDAIMDEYKSSEKYDAYQHIEK